MVGVRGRVRGKGRGLAADAQTKRVIEREEVGKGFLAIQWRLEMGVIQDSMTEEALLNCSRALVERALGLMAVRGGTGGSECGLLSEQSGESSATYFGRERAPGAMEVRGGIWDGAMLAGARGHARTGGAGCAWWWEGLTWIR